MQFDGMNCSTDKRMKLLKTLVPFDDGIYLIDTVEYEGGLWLVPAWIDNMPSKGYSMPVRIIRVPALQPAGQSVSADYVLANPLPKGVYEGNVPTELENVYVVIDRPNIVVASPKIYH
jgi:hypothetical protein